MDQKIYTHPLFNELINNIKFFFAGINMMSMPVFQSILIDKQRGEKSEIEISVKYNDFKCIKYDIEDVFNSFNKTVDLKLIKGKVYANIINLMNFQARQITISLFNILENSKFNEKINREKIFKFTKHLRNGAAHNNKFNFDKKAISELPITWRNKTIEKSFHLKKEVFGEFLGYADLILLVSDFSNIIKSYE